MHMLGYKHGGETHKEEYTHFATYTRRGDSYRRWGHALAGTPGYTIRGTYTRTLGMDGHPNDETHTMGHTNAGIHTPGHTH